MPRRDSLPGIHGANDLTCSADDGASAFAHLPDPDAGGSMTNAGTNKSAPALPDPVE